MTNCEVTRLISTINYCLRSKVIAYYSMKNIRFHSPDMSGPPAEIMGETYRTGNYILNC